MYVPMYIHKKLKCQNINRMAEGEYDVQSSFLLLNQNVNVSYADNC